MLYNCIIEVNKMEQIPNYNNKIKKGRTISKKRQLVLSVLLSASMTFSTATIAKIGVDALKDQITYNKSTNQYSSIIEDNTYRTNSGEHYFINASDVAEDIKELEIEDKYDLYHHLIGIAQNIHWNKNQNFQDVLDYFDLDETAKRDTDYPTEAEFISFLENHKLLEKDGTIDFDAWEKLDKKMINLENDLERVRMGK